jgi:hypothetical protein
MEVNKNDCKENPHGEKVYIVRKVKSRLEFENNWDKLPWKNVNAINIEEFLKIGSDFRPKAYVKAVYNRDGIYFLYKTEDKYVRCVNTGFQAKTCADSCAEIFLRPKPDADFDRRGYFNFEINCGGAMRFLYNKIDKDEQRVSIIEMTRKEQEKMQVYHSLPCIVEPEIKKETTWYIGLYVPFEIMEHYVGRLRPAAGKRWHANFYKCGDKTSHPHYGCWTRVDGSTFHAPHCFGTIIFEE